MKTTSNRYKNINYKLSDITKRKTTEINNRYTDKKKYTTSNDKEIENKFKKATSKSIKNKKNNLNRISQNLNNSFISNKERKSIKRYSELKRLNQTQESPASKAKKYSRKKK